MSGLVSQSEGSLLRVILRYFDFGELVQMCFPWIPGYGGNIGVVFTFLLYGFSGRCDLSINVFVPCLSQLGFRCARDNWELARGRRCIHLTAHRQLKKLVSMNANVMIFENSVSVLGSPIGVGTMPARVS